MIICNHLAASIKNPIILEPMFRNIGFICVSIFFFISGWGTMYGYLKKEDYLNGFVSRKITKILIPYLIAIILYSAAEIATGSSFIECLESFAVGSPVAKYSWYIIAVFVYYIEFWIAFKQKKLNPWVVAWILHALNLLVCVIVKWPMNWINTPHAFLIGGMMCQYKERICLVEKKKNCAFLGAVLAITFITTSYLTNKMGLLVLYWIGSTATCALIALISTKVEIKGDIWKKVALISFELYLYHGLTNSLLKHIGIIYQSNYIYCIMAYICAIFMAVVMHQFNKCITTIIGRKRYVES